MMEIKILGPGCANCHTMEQLAKTAVKELGVEAKVEKAAATLNRQLKPFEIHVPLTKKAIKPEAFMRDVLQSNKIVIADKTLEEWLGAETGQSPCCEVCGDAECRTVEYADQSHETVPADLIVKAGLIAASQLFKVMLPQQRQKETSIKMLSRKC